ncbi:hypothetical protein HPB49_023387 [Dermacentor silvarum]|uniref:Uncharacterized protein n=1 Tax=Dermacentor silvarum TaxID=543639 RepID=A0ACB8D8N6_DERSI|nr:hypothetical protein HPB49_023387 [Dermacentor silvarum]
MAVAAKAGNDPSTTQRMELEAAEARQDLEKMNIFRSWFAKCKRSSPRRSHRALRQPPSNRLPKQDWLPQLALPPILQGQEGSKCNGSRHKHLGSGQISGIGTAVQGLTGSTANAGVSVWPVWDQNIVVVGVKTEALASKLIGDVTLTIGDRQIPFHGHLKSAGETCKGVITVADTETSESLRHKLEWIDGEILYVRKLGTSNVAVVTFKGRRVPRFIHYCSENVPVRYYKKTVPACYRCGTLGHRADACPNPDDQRCIHCGANVNITASGPTKHNCQPKCLICGGNHFTGSAECVGKFRKAWKPTPPQLKHRQPGHHKQGGPAPPENGVKKPQNSKQRKTGQPKPSNVQAGPRSKPPTFQAGDFPPLVSPQQKVSSWAGVASQPPATTSPTPSEIEISKQLEIMQKRIATLERENQVLKAMQAPQRTEPESMQASASSDEEQESGSDLSGYTSVSKTETVVTNSEGIETRLSRLATKFEEENKMIMEQNKHIILVEHIIPQQVNLAVQAALQDLKQSLVPILTASILQTIQNWLTPQLEEIKASTKMPEQRRRKIVHRNPANSESEGTMEQPIAHQIETSMPTQAPTQAPVVMMPPPQQ